VTAYRPFALFKIENIGKEKMAQQNKDYELEIICEYTCHDGGRGIAIRIKNKRGK
jgi:hypothetical protein